LSALLVVSTLTVGMVAMTPVGGAGAQVRASNPSSVTWAELPSTPPNYIFPFMSLAYFSVANISQFQYLMYRPLYWFGSGATPDLNPQLSVADQPVYTNNDTTVQINLKDYKWSDGESLDAQDVMFWMNMLHSEKKNWAAYAPGGASIPDSVKAITINSPTELTFTLTHPFNKLYFTYNQLGQITPLPVAWDKTSASGAAGSGGCSSAKYGAADSNCAAVYTFLSNQSGFDPTNPQAANNALPTYATNPLWQVVDGPWHLTHFDANGNVTMQENPKYSGPMKPKIKTFIELPYTTDTAEFTALVGGQVNYGYLPPQDITASAKTPFTPGANNPQVASNFTLAPLYAWAINYFPYNYDSTGDGGNAGPIFQQLYFRQAMQYLVDQPLYISRLNKGYGVGTYGPVPTEPQNPYATVFEKNNPYKYNPQKAKSLLTAHGWKVVPNGTSSCQRPGTAKNECGKGIASGAKLAFTLQYATGATVTTNTMNAERSSWEQAGINMSLTSASFNTVIGNATPCPTGCSWELENWGAGWIFSPDYYPSGEEIFQTNAGSNSGNYSNPANDKNIIATNNTQVSLTKYENFLAKQLPVVFQPNFANPMNEIQKNLGGTQPANVLDALTPEEWYWKS
jgi:peptide/nickel transport system substrate-binding protein